jgi:hypothetical protein
MLRCLIEWLTDTDCMEHSPSWEDNYQSASQEISRLFWNPKVRYRVHKNPPQVSVLSQTNPVHTFPPSFHKIHSRIIFPSTPMSSEWSLSFGFSDQNFVRISHISHTCYMLRQSHPNSFDHSNNIWWSVQVMKLLIMQTSPAFCSFLLLRSQYSQHPVPKHPQSTWHFILLSMFVWGVFNKQHPRVSYIYIYYLNTDVQ